MRTVYTNQRNVPYAYDGEVLYVVHRGKHYPVIIHYNVIGNCVGCPMQTFRPCPLGLTGIFRQGKNFIYHTCEELEEVVE